MPIRKRITDPYAKETTHFHKLKEQGPAPKAPPKPTATERKPIYDTLMSIPIGKAFPPSEWRDRWIIPLMQRKFTLWGVELALYPSATRNMHDRDVCNSVMVCMLTRNARTGQFPKLALRGDKATWYGDIIRWISETVYGGG